MNKEVSNSQTGPVNQPLKPGDSECWNCAGINFISEELAKQGRRPTCYGFQYKASVKISDDTMKKLENVPAVPPNTKIFMFGLSQASARMHRRGQIPVLKYGIPIVMKYELLETNSSTNSAGTADTLKPPDNVKALKSIPLKEGIAARRPFPNDHPATISSDAASRTSSPPEIPRNQIITQQSASSETTLERYLMSYQRSFAKLWYDSGDIMERLPYRVVSSLDRMQYSVANRVVYSWDQLSYRLFGEKNQGDDAKKK